MDMEDVEKELDKHDERITKTEDCLVTVKTNVAEIFGSQRTEERLIKFVILPLLIILGGLVGIKLVLPV